jgi:hypothetical protein
MKDRQPLRENLVVDREGIKEELNEVAEKNKDNPIFIRLLKHALLLEISNLTFPGYKEGEKRSKTMLLFEIDLEKNTESFTQPGEFEAYCSLHGISFPSKPRLEQIKRVAAKTFKVMELAK